MKTKILSILSFIGLYSLISFLINKPYILPSFIEIGRSLIKLIISDDFLKTILYTLIRTFIGILISFIMAIFLSMISYKSKIVKDFFEPIYVILKTIPNITYIIICLLWIGKDLATIFVSLTVIFPIIYNSLLSAYFNIDNSLIEYTSLFNFSFFRKWKNIYFPLIRKEMLISIKNSASLALKVSIMAEMLSQTKIGIGRKLYYAKINIEMADIFAWAIVIIIISSLFELFINELIKKEN